MDFLVILHSYWRWAVLLAAVVAIVGALAGWLGRLPAAPAARRAGLLYTIVLDVEVLLGVILWVGRGWYAQAGYFRLEHPTTMLLALAVAHAGQVMARRSGVPTTAARTVALSTLVSLVLVVVGIPGVIRPR